MCSSRTRPRRLRWHRRGYRRLALDPGCGESLEHRGRCRPEGGPISEGVLDKYSYWCTEKCRAIRRGLSRTQGAPGAPEAGEEEKWLRVGWRWTGHSELYSLNWIPNRAYDKLRRAEARNREIERKIPCEDRQFGKRKGKKVDTLSEGSWAFACIACQPLHAAIPHATSLQPPRCQVCLAVLGWRRAEVKADAIAPRDY